MMAAYLAKICCLNTSRILASESIPNFFCFFYYQSYLATITAIAKLSGQDQEEMTILLFRGIFAWYFNDLHYS